LGFDHVTWAGFFVTNAAMEVTLIAGAAVGWRMPMLGLSGTGLIAINALVFHLVPTLQYGVYSPGLGTGLLLYLPTALLVYRGAWRDGILTWRNAVGSAAAGTAMMVFAALLERYGRL